MAKGKKKTTAFKSDVSFRLVPLNKGKEGEAVSADSASAARAVYDMMASANEEVHIFKTVYRRVTRDEINKRASNCNGSGATGKRGGK